MRKAHATPSSHTLHCDLRRPPRASNSATRPRLASFAPEPPARPSTSIHAPSRRLPLAIGFDWVRPSSRHFQESSSIQYDSGGYVDRRFGFDRAETRVSRTNATVTRLARPDSQARRLALIARYFLQARLHLNPSNRWARLALIAHFASRRSTTPAPCLLRTTNDTYRANPYHPASPNGRQAPSHASFQTNLERSRLASIARFPLTSSSSSWVVDRRLSCSCILPPD